MSTVKANTIEPASGGTVTITGAALTTPALGTPASGTLTNCTGLPASSVVNTPAGGISATTVQGALEELDSEKVSKSGGTMTDNLAFANGKGIDFSATPGTGTSELLDDYEEGTWTPSDASGASLAFTVTSARYTKIGRVVFAHFYLEYPTNASASVAVIGGLPFTSASNMYSPSVSSTNQGVQMGFRTTPNSTNISVMNLATNTDYSNTDLSGKFLIGMITYFV